MARDEAGKAIGGAAITLYTMTDEGSKPAGTATTDAEGHYIIRDAMLPVSSSFGDRPFPQGDHALRRVHRQRAGIRAWGLPGARNGRCTLSKSPTPTTSRDACL